MLVSVYNILTVHQVRPCLDMSYEFLIDICFAHFQIVIKVFLEQCAMWASSVQVFFKNLCYEVFDEALCVSVISRAGKTTENMPHIASTYKDHKTGLIWSCKLMKRQFAVAVKALTSLLLSWVCLGCLYLHWMVKYP